LLKHFIPFFQCWACVFITTHMNCCAFADVDQAVNVFSQLQQVDPNRLDNMDTYSNLLYVKVGLWLFCCFTPWVVCLLGFSPPGLFAPWLVPLWLVCPWLICPLLWTIRSLAHLPPGSFASWFVRSHLICLLSLDDLPPLNTGNSILSMYKGDKLQYRYVYAVIIHNLMLRQ